MFNRKRIRQLEDRIKRLEEIVGDPIGVYEKNSLRQYASNLFYMGNATHSEVIKLLMKENRVRLNKKHGEKDQLVFEDR